MSTAPIVTEPEKKPELVVELPPSPNAETDKRISEVFNEKKKKKHPVEARIAELTAKNAAIEEQAKKDKAELEAKLEAQKQEGIKAEIERRKTEAAANDKRPNREDFAGDANGTAEYTQKMAEWVIRQQDKIQAKSTPPAVTPTPDPVQTAKQKEEFDGFLEAGKKFIVRNPDFNEVLDAAAKRGLTFDNQAFTAIIRSRAPEVAYYLAKPENDSTARKFMAMDGMAQVIEVGKIAERLAVNPSDFVSTAGQPGRRLSGDARTGTSVDETDVDGYLQKRKADIKAGIRRR